MPSPAHHWVSRTRKTPCLLTFPFGPSEISFVFLRRIHQRAEVLYMIAGYLSRKYNTPRQCCHPSARCIEILASENGVIGDWHVKGELEQTQMVRQEGE